MFTRLTLLAVGSVPAWVEEGFETYRRRLPPALRPAVLEVAPATASERGRGRVREAETERLLRAVPEGARIIALDPNGEAVSTEGWVRRLTDFQATSGNHAFLIGGADGLAPSVRARSDWIWSLSPLTFPHALVRLIWIEQLYRAWTLISHHPYHRA